MVRGYKIAYVAENDGNFEVRYPVLVILDIPDNASRITPEDRYDGYIKWDRTLDYRAWDSQRHSYIKYRHHSDKALFEEYLEKLNKVQAVWAKQRLGLYYLEPYRGNKNTDDKIEDEFRRISGFIHASKCRASHAKVVDIIGLIDNEHYTHANSTFDNDFVYTVGEDVFPSSGMFNANELNICGEGIHYFETATLAALFAIDGINGGNTGMNVGSLNAKFMVEQLGIYLGNKGDCVERADFYVMDETYEEDNDD